LRCSTLSTKTRHKWKRDFGNQHRRQSSRDANRLAVDSYPPSFFFA
jgi:hypothetical protein